MIELQKLPASITGAQDSANSCTPGDSCSATENCATPGEIDASFDTEKLAELAKAIGHPARVKLLKYLADYGQCYFGQLTDILPLAPSTISQHVSILKNAGLIEGSDDEQRVCYCVVPARLQELKTLIGGL